MRSRRRWLLAIGAPLLVVGAGAPLLLQDGGGASAQGGEGDEGTSALSTEAVQRTDLVERAELDGTIGYGEPVELAVSRDGVVTALPEPGSTVDRGEPIAHVDGLPVTLFVGDTPLWRALQGDEEGPDVRVLEENLVALGFADSRSLTVDDDFTSATSAAVKRWQASLGWEQTGIVHPHDVVVRPAAVRIADQLGAVGSPAVGPILSVTGTERRVTMDLDAERQGLLAIGDAVEVTLPDGSTLPATIASIGTVATPGDEMAGTSATIEVEVSLSDPAAAGTLDQAPVEVSVVRSRAEDVLVVPVEALLALAEGGYAVERVTGSGTHLVAVDIGAFANGLVEVTGDVAEGDDVVVPS